MAGLGNSAIFCIFIGNNKRNISNYIVMKGTLLTIAALFLMTAAASAKGEPTTTPGAPTGYPDVRRITPVKVTYDDADAQEEAARNPLYIKRVKDNMQYMELVHAREYYVMYFTKMDTDRESNLNLNYGSNMRLAPIQGSIR